MSENRWLKFTGVDSNPNHVITCSDEQDQSPLDKVKTAIIALSDQEQRKIYEFLYNLGHRINR